jgi:hypothetical protein
MSLEQYKDATRKELWEILQIQVERIAELEAGIRRLIYANSLKSQENAMVELDELIKEQGE